MRRPFLAIALVAFALGAAACSSASSPGWTYAPPTEAPSASAEASASAGASVAPSGEASASASAPASSAPSESAGASASAPAAGETVQISAMNIAFEQTDVTAPAGTPFTIDFDNKEAVPHDIEIKDGSGASVFKGDIVTGPTTVQYQVPALAAGAYTFHCTIHPNMVGNLTAG